MSTVTITEPAQGKAVKTAKSNDKIKFPNVDSCMAIVFFLDDDSAVGGHVPMMWDKDSDLQPDKNFKKIVGMMKKQVGTSKNIVKIVTAGDRNDFRTYGVSSALPNCSNKSHVHLSTAKDVVVDFAKQTVS